MKKIIAFSAKRMKIIDNKKDKKYNHYSSFSHCIATNCLSNSSTCTSGEMAGRRCATLSVKSAFSPSIVKPSFVFSRRFRYALRSFIIRSTSSSVSPFSGAYLSYSRARLCLARTALTKAAYSITSASDAQGDSSMVSICRCGVCTR